MHSTLLSFFLSFFLSLLLLLLLLLLLVVVSYLETKGLLVLQLGQCPTSLSVDT
jgi:hypothetical protein